VTTSLAWLKGRIPSKLPFSTAFCWQKSILNFFSLKKQHIFLEIHRIYMEVNYKILNSVNLNISTQSNIIHTILTTQQIYTQCTFWSHNALLKNIFSVYLDPEIRGGRDECGALPSSGQRRPPSLQPRDTCRATGWQPYRALVGCVLKRHPYTRWLFYFFLYLILIYRWKLIIGWTG
jgi:hypothetical protein